jgi:mRNA-degrading endonuclease toxin of MazEF toxin-antitoxin module
MVIVSPDGRNLHSRANTVLAVPLSTTLTINPSHIVLERGETGLRETCEAQGENITVVPKVAFIPARTALRTLSASTVRQIASAVVRGMGVLPEELR